MQRANWLRIGILSLSVFLMVGMAAVGAAAIATNNNQIANALIGVAALLVTWELCLCGFSCYLICIGADQDAESEPAESVAVESIGV